MFKAAMNYRDGKAYSYGPCVEGIEYIMLAYFNFMRIQLVMGVLFRSKLGRLKGSREELMQMLSPEALVLFESQIAEDPELNAIHQSISLPVLRKLFLATHVLKSAHFSDPTLYQESSDLFKLICDSQLTQIEEYNMLFKHLNLAQATPLSELLIGQEDQTMRTQGCAEPDGEHLANLQSIFKNLHDTDKIKKSLKMYAQSLVNDKMESALWMPTNLALL